MFSPNSLCARLYILIRLFVCVFRALVDHLLDVYVRVVSLLGVVILPPLWDCRVAFVIFFVVVRPGCHLMIPPG